MTADESGPDRPPEDPRSWFFAKRLSPAQRRIAQFLSENIAEAGYLSSQAVADRVGVSQASVSRLATALGLDGWASMRRQFRAAALAEQSGPEGPPANKVRHAILSEVRNLEVLAAIFDDDAPITEAGKRLAASDPLVVVGLRASVPVADYFSWFAAKIHPDVRVVTGSQGSGKDVLAQARAQGAEWAVVFLLPRRPRETLELMRWANRLGMRLLVVTQNADAAVHDLADKVFDVPLGTELVFDSQLAPFALAAALLEAMADAKPKYAQVRLDAFEDMARQERLFF